jgi:hypothetical protein
VNTFAVAVPMANSHHEDIGLSSMFVGVDVTWIQHLRLEIQLGDDNRLLPGRDLPANKRKKTIQWALFKSMRELKTLRIVETFCENNEGWREYFHRFWHGRLSYQLHFQQSIKAVPFKVEIKTGLTK